MSESLNYAYIPLLKGRWNAIQIGQSIVDMDIATSYEYTRYKWTIHYSRGRPYAVRYTREGYRLFLHREILETAPKFQVDHISRDTLDNRRSNLRECTNQENNCNKAKRTGTSSQYKGVTWYKAGKKWSANITVKYKGIFLGYYEIEEDAARAYNEAAMEYHKEFAVLNVITKNWRIAGK